MLFTCRVALQNAMQESFLEEVHNVKVQHVAHLTDYNRKLAGMGSWERFRFKIGAWAKGVKEGWGRFKNRGITGNIE